MDRELEQFLLRQDSSARLPALRVFQKAHRRILRGTPGIATWASDPPPLSEQGPTNRASLRPPMLVRSARNVLPPPDAGAQHSRQLPPASNSHDHCRRPLHSAPPP